MSSNELRDKAIQLVQKEDRQDYELKVERKIRELEEAQSREKNKKLQNSNCPHAKTKTHSHGRQEECLQCGAWWSY